jgi:beta-N-acetylhexosaminidase
MSLGPLMLDVRSARLTDEDRQRLSHPLVGGVILFARNYQNPEQLEQLCAEIHALKSPPLLIAADQEGGRVQRFRDGFTRLPPMRRLGEVWDQHPHRAHDLAQDAGYVLGAELRARGVDLSFAPVLDLDYGSSSVIGDRAFHREPQAIIELAHAVMNGLKEAGMGACGKHFPGHGYIAADSHLALPVDEREYADLELADLLPFQALIDFGLPAMMPAHVVYPKIDSRPAGFSPVWLKQILRQEMGFDGMIFSDDLCMEGAAIAGDMTERVGAALDAGCDMALICNRPDLADETLARLKHDWSAASRSRLARLHGRPHPPGYAQLLEQSAYTRARHAIAGLGMDSANLALGSDPTDYSGCAKS